MLLSAVDELPVLGYAFSSSAQVDRPLGCSWRLLEAIASHPAIQASEGHMTTTNMLDIDWLLISATQSEKS